MKKIWERIITVAASVVMSATVLLGPAMVSFAANKTAKVGEFYQIGDVIDFGEGKYVIGDYYHNTTNEGFFLEGQWTIKDITFYGEVEDDYEVHLVQGTDTTVFYVPRPYGKGGFKFEFGDGTEESPFSFYKVRPPKVTTDWLDPLRTQLHIAADPEIGKNVNNTAEYTGDFALPLEIMQFIKDHPEVTLKYTFDYKGETHTVVITGKNVVVDEKIPWYGPEYLIGKYKK